MKKLNNKVYFTILSILTLSLLSFIIIFNSQTNLNKQKQVENSLNVEEKFDKNSNPPDKPNDDNKPLDENIKFMDVTMYTVIIENNNVKEIINHSNNNLSDEEIKKLATKILNSKNLKNKYIGNLYFEKYSYKYDGRSLSIMDNSNINRELKSNLLTSFLIFASLEILMIYLCNIITKWITTPVKESFERQKEFIADASHELKTPLSVIMASSEALESNPKETKWLTNIKTEAERMNNLIIELLELAKSEGKSNVTYTEGNLSKTVELSLLTFEGIAYEKKIKIDYDIKDNIKMLMNENNIKELVEILLDNAIKHSKENGKIKVTLTENSKTIELTVTNEGEGIPSGEEEKIFERFYRSDKSRDRSNSRFGLGLAIAKNIVTNHGGIVTAKSSEGQTTFKVLFKK